MAYVEEFDRLAAPDKLESTLPIGGTSMTVERRSSRPIRLAGV